jgi:hypothetical protein
MSRLTSSAPYEPKCWGRGGVAGSQPMRVQLYTGAQLHFGELTTYLTYDLCPRMWEGRQVTCPSLRTRSGPRCALPPYRYRRVVCLIV